MLGGTIKEPKHGLRSNTSTAGQPFCDFHLYCLGKWWTSAVYSGKTANIWMVCRFEESVATFKLGYKTWWLCNWANYIRSLGVGCLTYEMKVRILNREGCFE